MFFLKEVVVQIFAELNHLCNLWSQRFVDFYFQGCDGSVLLDDTDTIQSEKEANANNYSAGGLVDIVSIASERSVFSGMLTWSPKTPQNKI